MLGSYEREDLMLPMMGDVSVVTKENAKDCISSVPWTRENLMGLFGQFHTTGLFSTSLACSFSNNSMTFVGFFAKPYQWRKPQGHWGFVVFSGDRHAGWCYCHVASTEWNFAGNCSGAYNFYSESGHPVAWRCFLALPVVIKLSFSDAVIGYVVLLFASCCNNSHMVLVLRSIPRFELCCCILVTDFCCDWNFSGVIFVFSSVFSIGFPLFLVRWQVCPIQNFYVLLVHLSILFRCQL